MIPRLPVLPARRPRDVRAAHEPRPAVRVAGRLARPRAWWLLGATILVLIPTLLYYGGGWLQYGYRYFLDSVPFVVALCGLAAVRQGRIGRGWLALIAFGTVVMAASVYWAYNL